MTTQTSEQQLQSAKNITAAVYILYGLSYVVGITAIIGIIVNYIKLEDVAGTWLESHFRWQIRTFWFGLLWAIIGFISFFFMIGAVILFVNFIWVIYRLIKGFIRLTEGRCMYRESVVNF